MHKVFLTKNECSIIRGADEIIEAFGGFPSMENGELLEIHLEKQHERNRGSVSFVFDIADWKVSSSRYLSKERPAGFDQSRIKLTFQNCRDIKIVDPFRDLGEIKFGNSSDRKLIRQDEFPGLAPELERPFCVFYARSGESIIIDFDEETCIISAELC